MSALPGSHNKKCLQTCSNVCWDKNPWPFQRWEHADKQTELSRLGPYTWGTERTNETQQYTHDEVSRAKQRAREWGFTWGGNIVKE